MSANLSLTNPVQRAPATMLPQQQQPHHNVFHHQQQQQPTLQQAHQQPQVQPQVQASVPQPAAVDLDQKKLQDMIEAINLITNIRDDMNSILDNVGKANSSNNYATLLAGKQSSKSNSEANLEQPKQSTSSSTAGQHIQQNGSVGTPASVSNVFSQNQQTLNTNQTEPEQTNSSELNEKFYNLDFEEQDFFEKTDNKYLLDKVIDINKSIV